MELSSNFAKAKDALLEYMAPLEIVDCHEHLAPERVRLQREVDVLTLFGLYAFVDTLSAGLPTAGIKTGIANNLFLDTSIPLEERWAKSWPFLKQTRFGSYFRPTALALQKFYGIEKLDDSNYLEASERIKAANRPGLYHKVLRQECNIRTCMVQNGLIEGQDPPDLFTPVFSNIPCFEFSNLSCVDLLKTHTQQELRTLDEYLEALLAYLAEVRDKGAAGFKMASRDYGVPDLAAACEEYAAVLQGAAPGAHLAATVLDSILKQAAEWDWPVAVHAGVWGDFRTVDPKHFIRIASTYPGVRFELYHLGMPFARDAIFIAKSYANVRLNLCWCYAVSQEITRRSINEILDTVPVNKVFAFGADYIYAVENVYGHLVMARETLAEALAERIVRGQLDLDGAKEIATLWFRDNPIAFYGLG